MPKCKVCGNLIKNDDMRCDLCGTPYNADVVVNISEGDDDDDIDEEIKRDILKEEFFMDEPDDLDEREVVQETYGLSSVSYENCKNGSSFSSAIKKIFICNSTLFLITLMVSSFVLSIAMIIFMHFSSEIISSVKFTMLVYGGFIIVFDIAFALMLLFLRSRAIKDIDSITRKTLLPIKCLFYLRFVVLAVIAIYAILLTISLGTALDGSQAHFLADNCERIRNVMQNFYSTEANALSNRSLFKTALLLSAYLTVASSFMIFTSIYINTLINSLSNNVNRVTYSRRLIFAAAIYMLIYVLCAGFIVFYAISHGFFWKIAFFLLSHSLIRICELSVGIIDIHKIKRA